MALPLVTAQQTGKTRNSLNGANMAGKKGKGQKKVSKVMKEYGKGQLHAGKGGPVVTSKKQAVAIALSEAGVGRNRRKKSKK